MRFFIIFLVSLLFASEINIRSDRFIYLPKEKKTIFIGNVKITKDKDKISAKKIILYFDGKKPIKFIAFGNVKFYFDEKNAKYTGRAEKLIYFIKKGDIILSGNVFIKNLVTNESIKAKEVKLNRFTKELEVIGGKKPINIILKVD